MAAGKGVGKEALEQLRASLEQGWTILQDVDKEGGDPEWKKRLGVEVDEEVEDGVLYISLKKPVRAYDRVVKGKLKPEKEPVQRGDVSGDWVQATALKFSCTTPDEAVKHVTLKLQPYYRKEGPDGYAVKVELLDILWDGNLEKNQNNARGYFGDKMTIRLTAQWESDDRCPLSFSPPTCNDPITYQNSTQRSVQVGVIGAKPTAALTYSESTSQSFSSQPWSAKWERSSPAENIGSATLELKLNMMCSGRVGKGKYSFIPYNSDDPVKGKWPLGDVPQLPPPYDGNFRGWSPKEALSAGWSVRSSTFQAKKVCWKPEISLRISKLTAQTMAGVTWQRRWDKRTVLMKPDESGLVRCLPADQGRQGCVVA